ncbi:MAG: DUF2498 family protein [Candidatus Malihini olakiniferum]
MSFRKNGVLVFKKDYFLDEIVLSTSKIMAVFNMLKY